MKIHPDLNKYSDNKSVRAAILDCRAAYAVQDDSRGRRIHNAIYRLNDAVESVIAGQVRRG